MADDKFIEENREVLINEMAESIGKLNSIISSVLQAPIVEVGDGSLMRTYFMATAMQVGNLTTLFNQYYVLLKGVIPRKKRPAGFAALIKGAGISVANPATMPRDDDESPLSDEDDDGRN